MPEWSIEPCTDDDLTAVGICQDGEHAGYGDDTDPGEEVTDDGTNQE